MGTMRNRTGILFLLALILGVAPLMQSNAAQQRCAAMNGDDDSFFGFASSGCDSGPQSDLMKGLRFLSLVCVVCGIASGAQAWRERRREKEFLHSAGLDVDERDLPLDT
jgi:hypothetical protein